MEDKNWFAVYVRSRAEKKAFLELQYAEIEAFLPLVTKVKQWSDRKRKVEEPLFRSYVFVHISEKDFFKVMTIPHIIKFVSFEGKPVQIPLKQIEAIRYFLKDPEDVELPQLNEGQLVRVKGGSMDGLIGRLIKYKNKHRIWVMIEAIGQMIHLNIPRSKVDVVEDNK